MRRLIALVVLICSVVFVASSCTSQPKYLDDKDKFMLEENAVGKSRNLRYNTQEDIDELGAKLENKDSFILYIYLGESTDEYLDENEDSSIECPACLAFYRDILRPFISKYQVNIYSCSSTDAWVHIGNTYVKPYNTAPKLVVFKEGEIVAQESQGHNKKPFVSEAGLKEFIAGYSLLPLVKIDEEGLNRLLADTGPKIIYYGWSQCGDCAYLESHYLLEFIKKHLDGKTWYYFDVHEYRVNKTTDPDKWNGFVERVGINLKDNGGKVPTFVYYNNGVFVDAAVYFNDNLNRSEDGKYTVVGSYYEDAEIIGRTYPSYDAYMEGTASFHNQKFEEFMNKYYL